MKATQRKSESRSPEVADTADLPVFARRFVQARARAGMTLEQVAVAAEIEDAASVRMSQYQRGVHSPRFAVAQQLATALKVPVEFFYAPDDQTADLLLLWHALPKSKRAQLIKQLLEAD